MGLPGKIDSSVYEGLRDVLQRHPLVTTVTYEPNSIEKRFLRGRIEPTLVTPVTGPESPILDVEWRFAGEDQYYRIHYADPNTGFNCGWHRDEDHSELGPTHFQYELPASDTREHERARVDDTLPTEILRSTLRHLFEGRIPDLTSPDENGYAFR